MKITLKRICKPGIKNEATNTMITKEANDKLFTGEDYERLVRKWCGIPVILETSYNGKREIHSSEVIGVTTNITDEEITINIYEGSMEYNHFTHNYRIEPVAGLFYEVESDNMSRDENGTLVITEVNHLIGIILHDTTTKHKKIQVAE